MSKHEFPINDAPPSVLEALLAYHDAKVEAEAAKKIADWKQAEAAALMAEENIHSASVTGSGVEIKGTRIEAEVANVDYTKLQTLVSPVQWEKITKRVVDTDLLQAAIDTGEISADTIASCTEITTRKPYIKFTVKVVKGAKRWGQAARRKVVKVA